MSALQSSLPKAYTFWVATLLFGLPLLSSFYPVQYGQNSFVRFLLPYIVISAIFGFVILLGLRRKTVSLLDQPNGNVIDVSQPKHDSFLLGYVALAAASIGVVAYWLMTFYVVSAFPNPSPEASKIAGLIYLISLSITVAVGLPYLLTKIFPSLRLALSDKRSLRIAILVGLAYFFTYLILVNQIIITAFNTPPGNYVPPPNGVYPFFSAITSGPAPGAQLESAIYIPQFIVQINQYFNLVVMPFEFAFAIALSILVAMSIGLALFLIKRTSSNSCYTGATVSGMGSFFGFTATCPSCLAPTLVSVLSGGVSATAPAIYTHVSGVVLPPLVSIFALLVGVAILDYQAVRRSYRLKSILVAIGLRFKKTPWKV